MASEYEPPAKRHRHSQPDHADSLDSGVGSSQGHCQQPWETTENRTIQFKKRMRSPLCDCNKPAKQYQARRATENQGRYFWRCYLNMGHPDRCDYFQWEDELSESDYTRYVSATVPAETVMIVRKKIFTQKVKQVIKEKTVDVARLQMAVVGSFGAGKTCFCDTFFNHPFSKETDSTEGITWTHTCAFLREGGLQRKNRPLLEKAEENELLLRATASAVNLEELSEQVQIESDEVLQKACDGSVQIHCSEDSPTSEDLESVVTAVSSKKMAAGTTFVDVLDCGGQLSFSVLQSICFTAAGSLFVLAIKGTCPLDQVIKPSFRRKGHPDTQLLMSRHLKHKDYILLWLSTLANLQINEGNTTFGHETPALVGMPPNGEKGKDTKPRVVIVITHCAKLARKKCSSISREVETLVKESCAGQSLDLTGPFCIDSETKDGIPEVHSHLSKQINELAQCKKTNLFDLTVEHAIRRRRPCPHSRKRLPPIINIAHFRNYCTAHRQSIPSDNTLLADSCIYAESTPDSLVEYLHNHGTIRCFAQQPYKDEDFVFPNLQWLITHITKILSCTMQPHDPIGLNICEDVELLKERGILTTKLLRKYLWKMVEPEVQDHLLEVMEKFGLQCPIKKPSDDLQHHGLLYYVPMCICRADSPFWPLPDDCETLPAVMFASITDFLPVAFYGRLVVWLLQEYQLADSELQLDLLHMRFNLDGPCFVDVAYTSHGLAATVHVRTDTMSSCESSWISAVAHRLRTNIETQLRKLQEQDCAALNWKLMFPCRLQQQPSDSGKGEEQPAVSEQDGSIFQWLDCHWVDPAVHSQRTAAVDRQKIQEKMLSCKMCRKMVHVPPNWYCWLNPSYQFKIKKTKTVESSETAPCRASHSKGIQLTSGSSVLNEISKYFDEESVLDLANTLLEKKCPGGGYGFINQHQSAFAQPNWRLMAFRVLAKWCELSPGVFGDDLLAVLVKVNSTAAHNFREKLLGIDT